MGDDVEEYSPLIITVDINRYIGHLGNSYSPYLGGKAIYSTRSDFDIREFYTPKEGFTYRNIIEVSIIDKGVNELNLINKYVDKKWIPFYLLLLLILIFRKNRLLTATSARSYSFGLSSNSFKSSI